MSCEQSIDVIVVGPPSGRVAKKGYRGMQPLWTPFFLRQLILKLRFSQPLYVVGTPEDDGQGLIIKTDSYLRSESLSCGVLVININPNVKG